MLQSDLINEFLFTNTMSRENLKSIESYITCKTNNIPDITLSSNKYIRSLSSIVNQLYTENDETAKRAFRVAVKLNRNEVQKGMRNNEIRYQLYHHIGLDSEFMKFEIIESFNDMAQCYYINDIAVKTEIWLNSLKRKDFRNGFSQLFTYFSDDIKEILSNKDNNLPRLKFAQFILTALSTAWYPDKLNYIKELEKQVYGILKYTFSQDNLKEDFNILENITAVNFYEKIDVQNIFYNKNIIKRILTSITYLFRNCSELIDAAHRICLLEYDTREYLTMYKIAPEELQNKFENYSFPVEYVINIYAGQMLEYRSKAQWKQYYKKLETFYLDYNNDFLSAYQKCIRKGKNESFPLLSILLKNKFDQECELKEGIELFTERVHDTIRPGKKKSANPMIFIYEGKESSNFDVIENDDFSFDNSYIQHSYYDIKIGEMLVSCMLLFPYNTTARNVILLSLKVYLEYWSSTGIDLFLEFYTLHYTNDINPFEILSEKLEVNRVIECYVENCSGNRETDDSFIIFLKQHLESVKQIISDLSEQNSDFVINLLKYIFYNDIGISYKAVVYLLEHKQKTVINYIETILIEKPDEVKETVKMINSKNKNTKDAVQRLIKTWEENIITDKIRSLNTGKEITEYIEEIYVPAKKIPFSEEVLFDSVRFTDSEEYADSLILKFYYTEYMLVKDLRILPYCEELRKRLNSLDLRNFMNEIYTIWLKEGANIKFKNLLLPYSLSCLEGDILDLKKQIDIWTENARGALAAHAVNAMALNGSKIALFLTDGISRKYKNKQVKNAAGEALKETAKQLGMSREELEDKIIPDLGFNKERKKEFGYGGRTFTGVLNAKLEVSIIDEKGKIIKSLPKPNSNDNLFKAEEAKEELKSLKKQLKTVIASQKFRLEQALITGRSWTKEKWIQLFVDNPIMNSFAIGLIWAEIQNGLLLGTFRYMEDGSFNTADEEEYELQDNTDICLMHPMDIKEKEKQAWKRQLEDYEIIQPLEQLNIPVYKLTEDEKKDFKLSRFKGIKVYFGTIRSIMEKYGWKRTSVVDAGGYDGYYYEDENSQTGVYFSFDYLFVGMDSSETVKMDDIEFYEIGTMEYGSYCYSEINAKNRVKPQNVPEKLMSYVIMTGELIAQKSL